MPRDDRCRSVTAYGFGSVTSAGKLAKYRYYDKDDPGGRVRRNPALAKSAADVEYSLLRTLAAKGYIDLCIGKQSSLL
eukprot:762741-Pyramimonas_sp.AAC.1